MKYLDFFTNMMLTLVMMSIGLFIGVLIERNGHTCPIISQEQHALTVAQRQYENYPDITDFFLAIAEIESNHNDAEVGDKGLSFGRYQIKEIYWKDAVEQFNKTKTDFTRWQGFYKMDVKNKFVAERVMRFYYLFASITDHIISLRNSIIYRRGAIIA